MYPICREKQTLLGLGMLGAGLWTCNLLSLDCLSSRAHNQWSVNPLGVGIVLSTFSLLALISSSTRREVRQAGQRTRQSGLLKVVCATNMSWHKPAVCLSFFTLSERLAKMRFSEMFSLQINNQGVGLDLTCKL